MKNNIAFKLTAYFSMALLVFSIIIGSTFLYMYSNSQADVYERELRDRAEHIAETLSNYMEEGVVFNNPKPSKSMMGRMMGIGSYLRFIGDIAMSDVWIVDENLNIIAYDLRDESRDESMNCSQLPIDVETLIETIISGNSSSAIKYNNIIGETILTVGAPLLDEGNQVIGAVLLSSPLSINQAEVNRGIGILFISMIIALSIAFLISIIFAFRFTKPLKKMETITLSLAEGNYGIKNNIKMKDEIGQLAKSIDVLSDKLQIASEESEKLDNIRREFVANISHELKTPVTVIKSTLEGIIEGIVTEEDKKLQYEKQMLREANYLQRLIGDLLELSKLQNQDYILEKESLSLSQLLEDVLRSARQLSEKKEITIEYTKLGQNFFLIGDYGRLRQMLMIIIDNGIKFSDFGKTVVVELSETEIRILNTGEGISEEDIPHIFDRFYKSRSEKNKEGSGLGLPIAKEIADRHGMKIDVSSEEKGKTIFTIKYK